MATQAPSEPLEYALIALRGAFVCVACGRVLAIEELSPEWLCVDCGVGDELRAHALGVEWR